MTGRQNPDPDPSQIDPDLALFLALFREGRYWDSHEALERSWRVNGSRFYKGLILYASAFVHVRRGNAHGVRAQLRKTLQCLRPFAPAYLGFDVDGILAHAMECTERLQRDGNVSAVPPPHLDWDRQRVRGDEPELTANGGSQEQPGSRERTM